MGNHEDNSEVYRLGSIVATILMGHTESQTRAVGFQTER